MAVVRLSVLFVVDGVVLEMRMKPYMVHTFFNDSCVAVGAASQSFYNSCWEFDLAELNVEQMARDLNTPYVQTTLFSCYGVDIIWRKMSNGKLVRCDAKVRF